MNYENKSIKVYYTDTELAPDFFHHADMTIEPDADFIFITVGFKTRKTVLLPKNRILKFEITDCKDKEDGNETLA